MRSRIFAVGTLLLLWLIPDLVNAQFLPWDFVDVISDYKESGVNPDMVVDSSGTIHISYWHRDEDKLIYAFKSPSASSWTTEYVDITKPNGFVSAIDVDSEGVPHIVYQENVNWIAQVRYAKRTGTNAWTIEQIPGDPLKGWGYYGPNANVNMESRVVHSVDIMIDEVDAPQIVFFDGWTASNAACTANSVYGFKLHQAMRTQNGTWVERSFGHVHDTRLSCGPNSDPDTLPLGDRYGEYCRLVQRADNRSEVYCMSKFNNQLVQFQNVFPNFDTLWAKSDIDSLPRLLPGWDWSDRWYTIEGVSAFVSTDDNVHLSYTTSLFYGENFCCTSFLNDLVYCRIEPNDTIYHEFGVGTYRNYTDIKTIGTDSIYIVYADLNTFQFLLQQSNDSGQTWVMDTIMPGIGISRSPLEIIGDSLTVLIFHSEKERLLMARRHLTGGAWSFEEITRSENHGQSIDGDIIASGGDTIAHMAFNESYNGKLFYATGSKNNNWNWNIEQLASSLERVNAISFALTSGNAPVIAYAGGPNIDLRLAQWSGGIWNYEVVDTSANVGFTDMQVSASDTISVVYYDDNFNCLKYAWRHSQDSIWNYDFIDCGNQAVGLYPSLKLDAQEAPHIAYYDDYAQNLKYAVRNPLTRSWNIDSVHSGGASAVGKFASLELNAAGTPMIAFLDEQATAIYFAEKNLAGLWDITNVDSTPVSSIGRPIDLEIDQYGKPWIAYNFYSNFDKVKILRRDPGNLWTEVAVSSTGQIANAFDFTILGGDLAIIGKKNALQNTGVGMLYASNGLFVEAPTANELSENVSFFNFPNPFSEGTTFDLDLSKSQVLDLRIFDLYGKTVAWVLEKRKLSAGHHQFYFDAQDLPAGLYMYELTDGKSRRVKKLIIGN